MPASLSLEKWFKQVALSSPPPFLKDILENYETDYGELWAITAAPNSVRRRGIGKSVLAVKLLIHTYYRIWGRVPTWEEIKPYIFFTPKEFVREMLYLRDRKQRVPMLVWDDAGVWLFRSRGREKFIALVSGNMDLIRTIAGNVFFTTTSIGKLARGVRESVSYLITVAVRTSTKRADGLVVKRSLARLYLIKEDFEWLFHRKSAPSVEGEWLFTVWLPDEIYWKYFDYRSRYTDIVAIRTWKELEKAAEEAEKEEEAELEEAERGLRELSTSIDLKDLKDLKREWGYG